MTCIRHYSSFDIAQQQQIIDVIDTAPWNGAHLLASWLRDGSYTQHLGTCEVLLALDDCASACSNDLRLQGFCTISDHDCLPDPAMTPLVGFVFVFPEYRGHRISQQLIREAERVAVQNGETKLYLGTDHIGFYEKYGFVYLGNCIDVWDDNTRIYMKELGSEQVKSLSDMTLEELWQLFPIMLAEYDERWPYYFSDECRLLEQLLLPCALGRTVCVNERPTGVLRISHIGSTSVEGLKAKPIIDILVEIAPDADMERIAELTGNLGYRLMWQDESHISLNKGYTEKGFADKVFHLHIRRANDNKELYFRDYLRDHPAAALEYQQLKERLAIIYKHNRDKYTEAKGACISHFTEIAQKEYAERYDL